MIENKQVKIYLLNENKHEPKRGHNSNSIDIYFNLDEPLDLTPGVTYCVPMGVRMFVRREDAQHGDVFLMPRSSCSLLKKRPVSGVLPEGVEAFDNFSLRMANTFALIDWDYRGDIQGRVTLDSKGPRFALEPGKAYLQLIPRSPFASFAVVNSIEQVPLQWRGTTNRGAGGFGSTG